MRHALVIARRELEEKRFVALAAAGFAALPFLVAMIPSVHGGHKASEVITVMAGLLAIGFTGAVALALGGNVIGRDLAESRLSFYFSRPVGAASIWFGKVAAALVLIAGAFWLIVLPARLAGGPAWFRVWSGGWRNLALAALGGAVVLFFVAHVIGSFVRSRSPWVAVDFAALCVAGVTGTLILRPLGAPGAPEAVTRLAIAMGCGVAVALIGGGAWQLARGRTDRRRSHIALSQFLWTVVGATLALTGGFVAWMISATPGDLTTVVADMSRSGSWAIITGQARGRMDYHPVFAYNVDTGAYSGLDGVLRLWRANFTPDGKTLLLARADFGFGRLVLFTRPVQGGSEKETGLTLPLWSGYATTDDGGRIAAVDGGILTVYDVAQKRSLASARLPEDGRDIAAMYFASPTVVRVFTVNTRHATPKPIPRTLRLYEFDVARRALQQTGEFAREARGMIVSANADGSRLLVRDLKHSYVLDGRTAAVLGTLAGPDFRGAAFLRDGNIAVPRLDRGGVVIDIADGNAKPLRSFSVPVARSWGVRELSDGKLMLRVQTDRRPETAWQTLVIDPSTGAIVQRIPGSPVAWRGEVYWGDDLDPRRGPIDLAKVYRDAKGRLIRWDFAAQRAEVILPRG